MKKALITGITGQDGGHLTELLTKKGYEVYGIVRGQQNPKCKAVGKEFPDAKLIEADLTDMSSLVRAIQSSQPDEIYNLGAISHVGYSFKDPQLTFEVTGKGCLNLLEAIRLVGAEKSVKFYQASTSEMFGGLAYNRPGGGGGGKRGAWIQRNIALSSAQPIRRRETLRALDYEKLSRKLRHICGFRHSFQP